MTGTASSRAAWRTSTYSGANGSCVEVAPGAARIAVRDSRDPAGPRLAFTAAQWTAFTTTLKHRAVDL